jgi:hypothetical protein
MKNLVEMDLDAAYDRYNTAIHEQLHHIRIAMHGTKAAYEMTIGGVVAKLPDERVVTFYPDGWVTIANTLAHGSNPVWRHCAELDRVLKPGDCECAAFIARHRGSRHS